MRIRFIFPAVVVLLIVAHAATVTGQSPERAAQEVDKVLLKGFVIEGGRVNLIEGHVEWISGSNAIAALKPKQTFENGDAIQSGASGRAEILLIPGFYLRLDHNSRVTLLDLSRGNLKIKLWSGSAILEIATYQSQPVPDWVEQRRQLSYEPVSFLTPGAGIDRRIHLCAGALGVQLSVRRQLFK